VLSALGIVAALVSISGCTNGSESNGDRIRDEDASAAAKDALEQAGFEPSSELDVEVHDVARGQDTMVRFVLSGTSSEIEDALEVARWSGEFEPGNTISQTPLPDADTEHWTDVSSSSDTTTVGGRTVFRRCLRGLQDGAAVIHVWAFNT
jgi:hypothetical protein